jgi:uncharacterized protein YbjT (DUF2867 family)
MKVLLFGASGMVGQGVLRECLLDPDVERVQSIGRSPTGVHHQKLRETVHRDLWHYSEIEADLSGFDACFFCLGVSSAGMKAEEYEHITYGITLAAAETLCRLNPQMRFLYVSGAGTDSTEHGKSMWARVKGRTENALLRLPFAAAYMFHNSAGSWSEIEDPRLPSLLRHFQTTAAAAPIHVSQSCLDNRADWTGYADSRPIGLPQTYSRE